MDTRYVSAKLFWGLAVLSFIVGAAFFRRGLTLVDYLNPLFLLSLPRLIPFGVAALSAAFGLVYFVAERYFRHPPSVKLTLAHLALFLLGILGHVWTVDYLDRVLLQHLTNQTLPAKGVGLLFLALVASFVVFAVNIIRSARKTPQNA